MFAVVLAFVAVVLFTRRRCWRGPGLGITHEQRGHRRHEGEREDERADQGEHEGRGHRLERLALHALQREDRREHQQDDELTKRRRSHHLACCPDRHAHSLACGQCASQFGPFLAEHEQGGLDHDHRTVDEDAEVECAQAHQIAADPEAVHADHREQERQRDHQCGDRRRPYVAQQQKQHHDDEQCPFGQVLGYRPDRGIDQHAPVEHRLGDDARGQ